MKMVLSLLPLAVSVLADPSQQNQIPISSPSNPLSLDSIPLLGFGTWNLKEPNTSEAVSYAIRTGYRHIDCAAIYENEVEVGKGIRDGILRAGIQRSDLWITSKLWNDHHAPNLVSAALDSSLHKLGLTYLDLYHMHWPVADTLFSGKKISYLDTWGAMTLLLRTNKTRHVGVSNFSPAQLQNLLDHTSIPPAVHQMELHPYLQQPEWIAFHAKHNIHVTAYSPLGGTNPTYDESSPPTPLLENKKITHIAKKRNCTPAQVVLRWSMSRGTSVIPKSIHKDYIAENFEAPGCVLKKKDLKKINKLGQYHHRYNNPSKSWDLDLYEGLEDDDGKHGRARFWDGE